MVNIIMIRYTELLIVFLFFKYLNVMQSFNDFVTTCRIPFKVEENLLLMLTVYF